MKFPIENNVLLDAPVWEFHVRGRNWMAIINDDPRSPGGLRREFMERSRGRGRYIIERPEGLIGRAVEFGADYYSSSGRAHPNRWYGVIIGADETGLEIEPADTPWDAIRRAQELSTDRRRLLLEERERLLQRLQEIDRELEGLPDENIEEV